MASVEGRGFIAARTGATSTYFSVGTVTNTAKITNVVFAQLTGSTGWTFSGGASGDVISGQTVGTVSWITNVVSKLVQVAGYSCTGPADSSMDSIVVNLLGDPTRAQDYVASGRPASDCTHGWVQVTLAIGPSIASKDLHSLATSKLNIMITQLI